MDFERTALSKFGLSLRIIEPGSEGGIVEAISCFLTETSANLMESRGGHVPDELIRRTVHPIYTSRRSVKITFAKCGHRFTVCSASGEIVSTVLISTMPDIVLGFSGCEPVGVTREGLDPRGYHSIFNLAVAPIWRRKGVARAMLREIMLNYRSLFVGRGWWVRSEPPDHDIYVRLGFEHDVVHDGFVEGTPVSSVIFSDIHGFNEKFWCKCPRLENNYAAKDLKLRYWAFTQQWL